MYRIYFATRVRGFFKHLFEQKNIMWDIIGNNTTYELNSNKRKILSKITRCKMFDYLGIIQVIKCKNHKVDAYGSFNRFLSTDKPYFIYIENPTALYHYSLGRGKSFFGKRSLTKKLKSDNLKAIICMSKACYSTFDKLCGQTNANISKYTVYPYVPANSYTNPTLIEERCNKETINLLFIAQGIRFVSKGGIEVIESFKRLKKQNVNITLTIITSTKDLDCRIIENVKKIEGISLLEFNFPYRELEKIYSKHHLLLHPTSDDSFGLTILEAMKAGLPIISTRLYAIPEMVQEGINGFLIDPKYWFFDNNNLPNPKVWNNREDTIYSTDISSEIVEFICNKVKVLLNDKSLLLKMSMESYYLSNKEPFSEEYIVKQWNNILEHDFDRNNE